MRRSILYGVAIAIGLCLSAGLVLADEPVDSQALLKGFVHPPIYFQPGEQFGSEARKYQGIPTIELAPGGRLWAAWYAGPIHEDRYNYVMAATSDDNGTTWSDLKLVIDPDGDGPRRASDPCLWLDPDGRLWLFWWMDGGDLSVTMAITTDNPDDENPVWSEPAPRFPGVMINKPIVTAEEQWLMPAALWHRDDSCRVMISSDRGKTWALRGAVNVPEDRRNCDEPMLLQRRDGSLRLWVRTAQYGIGQASSTDSGRTWTQAADHLPHATSRFCLRRLRSGNLLLVKHGALDQRIGRSHLTAYLSDDDGVTWKGGLLLDERSVVSYPDATQAPDGTIYVIYDWNRADEKNILMTTFTEKDILAGAYASDVARQRVLVNRATGVNPKPWLQDGRFIHLNKNENGEPLLTGPRAVLDLPSDQQHVVEVGQPIFSDRQYVFHTQTPEPLRGKKFLFDSIDRSKTVCRQSGVVYVLTPSPGRNKDSLAESLTKEGFSLVSVPEFILFPNLDGNISAANACSVYQKRMEAGETIELGKWGVIVF